jgi:hypothetical protein
MPANRSDAVGAIVHNFMLPSESLCHCVCDGRGWERAVFYRASGITPHQHLL